MVAVNSCNGFCNEELAIEADDLETIGPLFGMQIMVSRTPVFQQLGERAPEVYPL